MSLTGPIVVIDDDFDDQFMIQQMLEELNIVNDLRLFENGKQAHDYLLVTQESPLLIFCDVNMPIMNGLELREHIDSNPYLKEKSIPFIFFTTTKNRSVIEQAYKGTIQGFFIKPIHFELGKAVFQNIIEYWKMCLHPNKFK